MARLVRPRLKQALGYPGDEVASILDDIMDTKQKKSREAKVYSPFRRAGGAVRNL